MSDVHFAKSFWPQRLCTQMSSHGFHSRCGVLQPQYISDKLQITRKAILHLFFTHPKCLSCHRQAKSSTSFFAASYLLAFGAGWGWELSAGTRSALSSAHIASRQFTVTNQMLGLTLRRWSGSTLGQNSHIWCWKGTLKPSLRVVSITLGTEHWAHCTFFFATDLIIVAELLAVGFWPDGFKALD